MDIFWKNPQRIASKSSVSLNLMNHKRSLISEEQLTNGGGKVFH